MKEKKYMIKITMVNYMVKVLALASVLILGSCSTLNKTRSERDSSKEQTVQKTEETERSTHTRDTFFDRSLTNRTEWNLELVPIDPFKPVSHWKDTSGRDNFENARPIWTNSQTMTENNKGGITESETDESLISTEEIETSEEESEDYFSKLRIGIPWWVWPILVLAALIWVRKKFRIVKRS